MQVNGSASGSDDIGPDLLQRYDVTGSGGPDGYSPARTSASVVVRVGFKNLSDFIFCSYLVLLVLAFFDSSLLSCHFSPFTEVVRKTRREVTPKMQKP